MREIKSAEDLIEVFVDMCRVFKDKGSLVVVVDVKRTPKQNNLSHEWYRVIAAHTGESLGEVRRRCKLDFGVDILRRDSREFDDEYRRLMEHLGEDEKLAAMDKLSITSAFTRSQMWEYLQKIKMHYATLDVDPVFLSEK